MITKTIEDYEEAEEGQFGWCTECGETMECIEPDYEGDCEECGGRVIGSHWWLIEGRIV